MSLERTAAIMTSARHTLACAAQDGIEEIKKLDALTLTEQRLALSELARVREAMEIAAKAAKRLHTTAARVRVRREIAQAQIKIKP